MCPLRACKPAVLLVFTDAHVARTQAQRVVNRGVFFSCVAFGIWTRMCTIARVWTVLAPGTMGLVPLCDPSRQPTGRRIAIASRALCRNMKIVLRSLGCRSSALSLSLCRGRRIKIIAPVQFACKACDGSCESRCSGARVGLLKS